MRENKIRELVRIVQDSDIDELEIRTWWGRRIRIKKNPAMGSEQAMSSASTNMANIPVPAAPPNVPAAPEPVQTSAPVQEKVASEAGSDDDKQLLEIKAPMVGTFYTAPAPDAEPYIKVGDMISPGQVLCIIEAMKLMNEIESEISGRIVKIMGQNAQPVEYNQTLFLVEPSKA